MQRTPIHAGEPQGYRGRVRSGCLTCRSRRVKCPEQRPECHNCTRLKRRCVYAQHKARHGLAAVNSTPEHANRDESVSVTASSASPDLLTPPGEEDSRHGMDHSNHISRRGFSLHVLEDPFQAPDDCITECTSQLAHALRRRNESPLTADGLEGGTESPSTLISRDIRLTTTMDLLVARELPLQPLFSFFLDAVDCPAITAYDMVNWQRVKTQVVRLAMSHTAVASSVTALSILYKALLYSLPLSKALSLYGRAVHDFETQVGDESADFNLAVVVSFILSVFAYINYQDAGILQNPSAQLLDRFRTWAQNPSSHTDLSRRLIAWFHLLQTSTSRGGHMGLLSADAYEALSLCPLPSPLPHLRPSPSDSSPTSTQIYAVLSSPLFAFYLSLQLISGDIAKLTHYHRSRHTGSDQDAIVTEVHALKSRLNVLWDSRCDTQRQTPADLRANLAPAIANPLITLVGLCAAAYAAEFVEIDRLLGDPVSTQDDAVAARARIREIVDGDYSPCHDDDDDNDDNNSTNNRGKLNGGYLRPLFMYAIECRDADQNAWAVERLRRIADPVYRSDFFAAFGKALGDAQLKKERRVTSKYFCVSFFGVPPPYL